MLKHHVRGPRIKVKVNVQEEQKTVGGIIIPTETKGIADSQYGVVVEVGDTAYQGLISEEPWVKVGDVILFQRYGGKDIEEGGELFRFLKDIDVIAVVEDIRDEVAV